MISFLVKICAFVFASTHLSFLPYCQVYQPEQQKVSSIMSPNNNERTYIMVKVRSVSPVIYSSRGMHLIEEDRSYRPSRVTA